MMTTNVTASAKFEADAIRAGIDEGTLPEDVWTVGVGDGREVRFYSNDAAACHAINAALEEAGCDLNEVGWYEVEAA